MRPCTVCQHEYRDKIDADLLNNRSLREMERDYGVGHMALQRHRSGHISIVTPTVTKPKRTVTNSVTTVTDEPVNVLMTGDGGAVKPAVTWKEMFHAAVVETENPESQFKQAWYMARDDERMRARMVAWLNEQLQADDMGLS